MSLGAPGFVPLVVMIPPDGHDLLTRLTATLDTGLLSDIAARHGVTAEMLVAGWVLHQALRLEVRDI